MAHVCLRELHRLTWVDTFHKFIRPLFTEHGSSDFSLLQQQMPYKMVNFEDDMRIDGPVVVPDLDVPLPEKQEAKQDKGKRFFFFKKKKAKVRMVTSCKNFPLDDLTNTNCTLIDMKLMFFVL